LHVTGLQKYQERLDTPKLVDFLRDQGMSEEKLDTLEICFVHQSPGIFGRFTEAQYHYKKHKIFISTHMFSDELSANDLRTINDWLVHEVRHSLDSLATHQRDSWRAKFIMVIPYILVLIPTLLVSSWFACIEILVLAITPIIAYVTSPGERRARDFSFTYGQSHHFFISKDESIMKELKGLTYTRSRHPAINSSCFQCGRYTFFSLNGWIAHEQGQTIMRAYCSQRCEEQAKEEIYRHEETK
jgi:hypothetical protein